MTDSSATGYAHLGPFGGLVAAAKAVRPLFGKAPVAGAETQREAKESLRFTMADEQPQDIRSGRSWSADGVHGEEVSWSVGFGPRTEGFVLKPAEGGERLPGIIALHDHGHFKFFGKEKIADGPDGYPASLAGFRQTYYGGRAYANLLARSGFIVLVHDTFLWGSRKFPLEIMPDREQALAEAVGATLEQEYAEPEIVRYNGAAYLHEHLVSKYCTVLGTSLAAVIAYEDRVALNLLRMRADVAPGRIGCVGLSGGGLRAALLRATSDELAACVIVGMMSTYDGLLSDCIAPHTWMLFPAGWSVAGDWPDLAASAAPSPLLVQFLLDDVLFTVDGMRNADSRMAATYARGGEQKAYTGEFYPGPHRFDVPMQDAAFTWLRRHLSAQATGAAETNSSYPP
jgi:dienelactone hydrolase